ncbi:MAG: 3-deoxy-D-manno-octulosonic acid transferase, partial [Porphyromonas sp.]
LSSVYRYGTWAYVGGGFGKSVHNTLEAAVYGIPVFFGPEIHKHREVRELVARASGFILHDQDELAQLLDRFSSLEECQALRTRTEAYFAEERGATEAILSDLFPEE